MSAGAVVKRARFTVPVWGRMRRVTVTLLDMGGVDRRGQTLMTVRFTAWTLGHTWEADSFAGSPLHADDSAETLASAVTLALECARQDGTLPAWLGEGIGEHVAQQARDRAERGVGHG